MVSFSLYIWLCILHTLKHDVHPTTEGFCEVCKWCVLNVIKWSVEDKMETTFKSIRAKLEFPGPSPVVFSHMPA